MSGDYMIWGLAKPYSNPGETREFVAKNWGVEL
jgi:hypothetical protein